MKKIIIIIIASILMMPSCLYEEYKYDFEYTAVYFPKQQQTRSFVGDEISTIKIGVVIGGKRYNDIDEWAAYEIQPAMLEGTEYELLPLDYYQLSNSSIIDIHTGDFQGEMSITVEDELFSRDSVALAGGYALAFRLTDTSLDSILAGKDSLIVGLRYECRIFGNYYHNGITYKEDGSGNVTDTIIYHQKEPFTNSENNWSLTTSGRNMVSTNGISKEKSAPETKVGFNITIDASNVVTISEDTASLYKVIQDEYCIYNPEDREFYMSYRYEKEGYTFYAKDTLIFRNRILDGVNQWQF